MEFQGFQNSLPLFLIISIAASLVAIAFYAYRNLNSIPTLPRTGLIFVRSLALLLIFLLFLNPYYFSSETVSKNPRLLFLLDDSESLGINKGDYKGTESYLNVLTQLNLSDFQDIDVEFFTLGSSSKQIQSPDSLKLKDAETNFANAISQIQELEDNFDASVLLSDGIITYGRNPSIQASEISIPLYTIALGDTTNVRDITVNNIVSNPNGFTDTKHIVEVEIAQNGFADQRINVELRDSENRIIDSKSIEFNSTESVTNTSFELELTEAGLQQYSVKIQPIEGEWSTDNNSGVISIDVSDSKTRIIHIAFEVHPDVKMIRSILSEDQNIELSTLTWLGGSRFIENEIPDLIGFDLLIIHGLPSNSSGIEFISEINTLPTVYLQLPKTRTINTGTLSEINLLDNSGNQLFQLSLFPAAESNEHPVLELPEIGFQTISPVISSLRSVASYPDAIDLFKSGFQGIETPNTIISVYERGLIRRATISAWGWYRLYQSPLETERMFVTQLFNNIITWTANDPDERRMKIIPSKSVFNLSDQVIINGNLNNESGEPESEATIEFTLTPQNGDEQTVNMSNEGNGVYKFESSSLSPGLYSYSAIARKGGREIDTQTGEFLIQDSNSELINTVRNDELLMTLSNETGGRFFEYDNLDTFWTQLNNDDILQKKEELVESYIFPVRSAFWFMLVLILLGTEWFGRKYYSLP